MSNSKTAFVAVGIVAAAGSAAPAPNSAAQCVDLAFTYTPGNSIKVTYRVSGSSTGKRTTEFTAVGDAVFEGKPAFRHDERLSDVLETPLPTGAASSRATTAR